MMEDMNGTARDRDAIWSRIENEFSIEKNDLKQLLRVTDLRSLIHLMRKFPVFIAHRIGKSENVIKNVSAQLMEAYE